MTPGGRASAELLDDCEAEGVRVCACVPGLLGMAAPGMASPPDQDGGRTTKMWTPAPGQAAKLPPFSPCEGRDHVCVQVRNTSERCYIVRPDAGQSHAAMRLP